MKKKIAIIGAGLFQVPLILKARELGYETHVFAWEEGAVGKVYCDYFYPISITEKEIILEKCKEIQPEGIVSIGSDLAVLTVNYVSRFMGFPSNPEIVEFIATNKYAMRKAFQNSGIKVPRFFEVAINTKIEENLKDFKYPLIVKPTDRSGSRGIREVFDIVELKTAINIAIEESFEKKAIVEEYIAGKEYSCEVISHEGRHFILAITQKYTTGNPDYIETAHIEPSDIAAQNLDYIHYKIQKCLSALQITNGASHCEFKITPDNEFQVIEIGARMGGDCIGSDLVFLSTGIDFMKCVIDVATGKAPDLSVKQIKQAAAVRFIFNQKDLEVLHLLQQNCPELLYRVSDIKPFDLHTVKDSSGRYGYYIMTAPNKEILYKYLP